MNTNLILGSTWIENERFNFERRIKNMAQFIKQKTVMNANMWTPKQLVTTQTIVFCSNGDEDRMGASINEDESPPADHMFLADTEDGYPEWEALLWSLGHKGVVPGSDPQKQSLLAITNAQKCFIQQQAWMGQIFTCRIRKRR